MKKTSLCEHSFFIIPRFFVYKFYLLRGPLILEDEKVYFNDIWMIQGILHDNLNLTISSVCDYFLSCSTELRLSRN